MSTKPERVTGTTTRGGVAPKRRRAGPRRRRPPSRADAPCRATRTVARPRRGRGPTTCLLARVVLESTPAGTLEIAPFRQTSGENPRSSCEFFARPRSNQPRRDGRAAHRPARGHRRARAVRPALTVETRRGCRRADAPQPRGHPVDSHGKSQNMLGTRVTSFAFGFACASGISMYKLKEDIWSSHKILADQVRLAWSTSRVTRVLASRRARLTHAFPPRKHACSAPTPRRASRSSRCKSRSSRERAFDRRERRESRRRTSCKERIVTVVWPFTKLVVTLKTSLHARRFYRRALSLYASAT